MYVVSVTFPTSNKLYDYLMKSSLRIDLNCGDKIQIKNDKGYDYRESIVTIKKIQNAKDYKGNGTELREIVDFKMDGSTKWHEESRNSYLANCVCTGDISFDKPFFFSNENLKYSFAFDKNETYNIIKKENSKMNKMFNFKYGKVNDSRYA